MSASLPNGPHLAFVADVRDCAAVTVLVELAERRLGGIDILVNCAGVFYPTPAGSTDEAAFDRMVDINLKGTWNAINAVAPLMTARRRGWIVNLGSVVAAMGFGRYAVYCATKAAIVMMNSRARDRTGAAWRQRQLPLARQHRDPDEPRHSH